MNNGRPERSEDFITGWLVGETVTGRPVGIVTGPDGALYVSDDNKGFIYWVAASDHASLGFPVKNVVQPTPMTPKWALVAALLAFAPCGASAQSTSDHTYTSQDIEAGARIYSSQCALCHGANGDTVNGVNLRLGRFRRAITDEDLAGVVTNGVATGGMPSVKLSATEMTAIIAFIRAGFDPTGVAVKVGNVARGQSLYGGKGKCASCHRINGIGPRTGARLERHRRRALAERAAAIPARAERGDVAD